MTQIKWRKIDPQNLPQGEVLALTANNSLFIGVLGISNFLLECTNDYTYKTECTHYLTESDLLSLEKE